jgi:hypothetical protein
MSRLTLRFTRLTTRVGSSVVDKGLILKLKILILKSYDAQVEKRLTNNQITPTPCPTQTPEAKPKAHLNQRVLCSAKPQMSRGVHHLQYDH